MKKRMLFFVAVIMAAAVISAGLLFLKNSDVIKRNGINTGDNTINKAEITKAEVYGSYNDSGYFFINDDHMISYMDPDSGKISLVCSRTDCQHKSKEEDPDTDCQAEASKAVSLIQNGNYIYILMYSDGDSDYSLYREKINGSDRKKICTIEGSSLTSVIRYACNGRYLAAEYLKNYDIDEKTGVSKELKTPVNGFFCVDLKSYECKNIIIDPDDFNISEIVTVSDFTMNDKSEIIYSISGSDEKYNIKK